MSRSMRSNMSKQDVVARIVLVKEVDDDVKSEFTFGGENITMDTRPLDRDQKTISEKAPDYSEKAFPIPEYDGEDDAAPKADRRKIVNEFVDNATTHGVPRVLNSSRPLVSRLFWCVVTLALVGALLYQGSQLVIAYIGRPTSTKISLITKSKLEFPAVTICNLNMMRRSKMKGTRFQGLADLDREHQAKGIGVDESDYTWFFDELSSGVVSLSPARGDTNTPPNRRRRAVEPDYYDNDEYDYGEFASIQDPNDWKAFYNRSTSSDYSDFRAIVRPTKEELREFGHQARDFILQCTFDTEPCTFKNFTVIQNAEYGNCFVFNNAHKLKRRKRTVTTRTGSQYGLHLTLMVEQPEYIGILSPDSGVKVAISDPLIYAFPEDDGIAAPPGFATSIAIKKTTIKRLPYPYGDCKTGHKSYYQPEKYQFSQRSCSKLCLQKTLNSECNCITDILISNGTMCGAIDKAQVQCRSNVLKKFLRNRLNCDCSNPCSETVFSPRISSSRWPSARYEAHLYNRLANISRKAARILTSEAQSRNNLVNLRVFFEELNFERVVETPLITEEALFGGVGGLMGLYVGMSFISLMEIVVFLMELLRSSCCSKGHSSKKTKVSGL